MIRKTAYPDQYPDFSEMWTYHENGTVNHDTLPILHLGANFHTWNSLTSWCRLDHCIDALRQSIMCEADVTPVPFHHNPDNNYMVVSELAPTRTCRDLDKIKKWPLAKQVAKVANGPCLVSYPKNRSTETLTSQIVNGNRDINLVSAAVLGGSRTLQLSSSLKLKFAV